MDGLIIIDKPKGYTSHDVVNVLRKILDTKKIGHTGTLDPNATGVLPILVGQATKLSKYLIEHDKTYIAKIRLGQKTDTGDEEGNIINNDIVPSDITEETIKIVLDTFIGKQKQIPPIYSAIKVDGKKLYEYARQGQQVEVDARDIEVYNIELQAFSNNEIIFKVECSKGTYIRVLCEDIAERLGTVGYMKDLKRIKVDKFEIGESIGLEEIKEKPKLAKEKIISIETIFYENKEIELNDRKLELFLNGVILTFEKQDGLYRIYNNKRFIGVGTIKDNMLKRDVVLA